MCYKGRLIKRKIPPHLSKVSESVVRARSREYHFALRKAVHDPAMLPLQYSMEFVNLLKSAVCSLDSWKVINLLVSCFSNSVDAWELVN
jgi:hypothetical protein